MSVHGRRNIAHQLTTVRQHTVVDLGHLGG